MLWIKALTTSFLLALALGIGAISSAAEHSAEKIGELSVTDLMLEPTFISQEPEGTSSHGFIPGRSYLAVGWKQDAIISARLMLGSRTLIVQPARYGLQDETFGIIEGYAQADSPYGQVRMGYIPILFGHEGASAEYEQLFPLSLLYQSRVIMRRDLGASYAIDYNDFYSYIAVHNGEGSEDRDRRLWLTARLAYKGPAKSEMGISGMTGRSVDLRTMREEKIRTGNVFAGFNVFGLGLSLEGTMSTILYQGNLVRQLAAYHVDVLHPLRSNVGLQMRYDYLDPDHGVQGDIQKDFTLGLRIGSQFRTSSFYILGVKRMEESFERINDKLLLIWRISPWLPE